MLIAIRGTAGWPGYAPHRCLCPRDSFWRIPGKSQLSEHKKAPARAGALCLANHQLLYFAAAAAFHILTSPMFTSFSVTSTGPNFCAIYPAFSINRVYFAFFNPFSQKSP